MIECCTAFPEHRVQLSVNENLMVNPMGSPRISQTHRTGTCRVSPPCSTRYGSRDPSMRGIAYCIIRMSLACLRYTSSHTHIKIHQIKINVLSVNPEKRRKVHRACENRMFHGTGWHGGCCSVPPDSVAQNRFAGQMQEPSPSEWLPRRFPTRLFQTDTEYPRWRIRFGFRFRLVVPIISPFTLARYYTLSVDPDYARR